MLMMDYTDDNVQDSNGDVSDDDDDDDDDSSRKAKFE